MLAQIDDLHTTTSVTNLASKLLSPEDADSGYETSVSHDRTSEGTGQRRTPAHPRAQAYQKCPTDLPTKEIALLPGTLSAAPHVDS